MRGWLDLWRNVYVWIFLSLRRLCKIHRGEIMTDAKLSALEAAARAATPVISVLLPPSRYEDAWHVRDEDDTAVVRCYGFNNEGNGDTAKRLAEYIAAANPTAILELIAWLRQADEEADWLASQLASQAGRSATYWRKRACRATGGK